MPGEWVQRLPTPAYVVARRCYRAIRETIRIGYWIASLVAYRLTERSARRPVVGLHTVFIAKENILFLKEWILYHKLKGVTHFFLYDNTGVTRSSPTVEKSPHSVIGRVSKYAVPYDDIVRLADSETRRILDDIQREIPDVTVVRWQPRDSDGNIMYAQTQALNDALSQYGEIVDWMVFMDMDEFMVSDESVPELCSWMESRGYDGGVMCDRPMSTRLDNVDRYVIETDLAYRGTYKVAPKYMCDTGRVVHANVHSFSSRGRQHRFDSGRLFFLHYKMPSRHPEMRGYFQKERTAIASDLIDGVKALAGEYCTPEWRLSAVHPDWRRKMESVYPWWHLDDGRHEACGT